MKHSKPALLHAIRLAGSQAKLATILGISPTQLSAWVHNPQVNMPIKYGDMIEEWSENQISKKNLFPMLKQIKPVEQGTSVVSQINALVEAAASKGVDINVTIALNEKPTHRHVGLTTVQ